MGSRDSLKVILRVPVWVINNNHSSFGQIYAEAAGAGRQQKNPEFIIFVEPLDTDSSVLALHRSSQNLISYFFVDKVIFDDISHPPELREYEHLMVIISILLYKHI